MDFSDAICRRLALRNGATDFASWLNRGMSAIGLKEVDGKGEGAGDVQERRLKSRLGKKLVRSGSTPLLRMVRQPPSIGLTRLPSPRPQVPETGPVDVAQIDIQSSFAECYSLS